MKTIEIKVYKFKELDKQTKEKVIENNWIASKSCWTPYDGFKVMGWPISTIVRGNIVMKDMEVLGKPSGKKIKFSETI